MKSWMRERDLLIQQTMDFVNCVASTKASLPAVVVEKPAALETACAAVTSVVTSPTALVDDLSAVGSAPIVVPKAIAPKQSVARPLPQSSEPIFTGSVRDEVARRVAVFKAHQQKLQHERTAEGDAILGQARATLGSRAAL